MRLDRVLVAVQVLAFFVTLYDIYLHSNYDVHANMERIYTAVGAVNDNVQKQSEHIKSILSAMYDIQAGAKSCACSLSAMMSKELADMGNTRVFPFVPQGSAPLEEGGKKL